MLSFDGFKLPTGQIRLTARHSKFGLAETPFYERRSNRGHIVCPCSRLKSGNDRRDSQSRTLVGWALQPKRRSMTSRNLGQQNSSISNAMSCLRNIPLWY